MKMSFTKVSFLVVLSLLTSRAATASDKFLLTCKAAEPEHKLMSELISIELDAKGKEGVAKFVLASKEVSNYLIVEGNMMIIMILQDKENPWVTEKLVINRITGQFLYSKETKERYFSDGSENKEFGGQCEKRDFEMKF
ncbi:hypothetical protein [Arsukibacterium indicum]|uniref:Uncharacterized protein n=1 Tax=Arsukibacterium indicum TaxID=2848612 RepID=A0ABS6MJD9_9GAMM|nr:hypothetical protein [Arsukibacterium indicum]MBV2128931.1 hypothetical protein [Arsukibacterium indicum]